MRTKIKISDIFAYIIGNYRYWCYNNFKPLLRLHIIEQYEWRLSVMNKECYSSGSCIECGCDTPALQMANKACKGGCYFEMYDKKKWEAFKITIVEREKIKDYVPPTLMHPIGLPTDCYVIGYDPYKEEKENQGPIIVRGYHSRDPRVQGMTGIHEYLVRQEEKLKNKE